MCIFREWEIFTFDFKGSKIDKEQTPFMQYM